MKLGKREKAKRLHENRVRAFNKVLAKVAVRQRDFQQCMDSWASRVHDPHEGDSTKVQMDVFDAKPWLKAQDTIVEFFIYQELGKLFDLDDRVQAKMMENLINRKLPPLDRKVQFTPAGPPQR